uniref:RRM domain-containing protein n=1 Tax=Strigamia maritima TaxID=126957 RepID=T1JIY3_STRMM
KLFVGGLSWETTQDTLCRFFTRFGEVIDCVVMKNNETGRSRGFGFVTFKDPGCVQVVLSSGPHSLDGRTIDPKACNPRSMQKGSGDHKQVQKNKGNNPKIFLGGLPSNITETDLKNFFSKYGSVLEVVIMYDQEKKRSRGFGFLSFETEDSVEQVCAEHYVNVNGKQVECKKAEPRDGPRSNKLSNQWNGTVMGLSPGIPPHMGGHLAGPMAGPGMGPPPMGPMANGMPIGASYQPGGWGGPQQTAYGQGYGAPPPNASYQGWGAPGGYGPYGTAQYGTSPQGGFGGFDVTPSTGYPGYTWGTPTPASPAGPMPPAPGTGTGTGTGTGSGSGSGTGGGGNTMTSNQDHFNQNQTGTSNTSNASSSTTNSSAASQSASGMKSEFNSFSTAYGEPDIF